jgi:hypothetical protein
MSKLLKSGEVGKIGMEHMKKIREEVVKKWKDAGFLDGLSGHVKENIADLYCCKATSLLKDPQSSDTKENKEEDEI